MARDGVRRGLAAIGASGTRPLLIEDKIWRLGEVIADEVAGSVAVQQPAVGVAEVVTGGPGVDVLLVAESVADVGPLVEVAAAAHPTLRVGAVDLELVDGDSGANAGWRRAGIAIVPYHRVVVSRSMPLAVIGCAPVGPTVRDLLTAAQAAESTCVLVQVPNRPPTLPAAPGRSSTTSSSPRTRRRGSCARSVPTVRTCVDRRPGGEARTSRR